VNLSHPQILVTLHTHLFGNPTTASRKERLYISSIVIMASEQSGAPVASSGYGMPVKKNLEE